MKIELTLSPATITIITATLQAIYNTKAHTRRHKSTLSIALEVAKRFDAKIATFKSQSTLFEQRKKTKISLKFYEADMLELLLIDQIKSVDETLIRQQIQKVIDMLNQKLA